MSDHEGIGVDDWEEASLPEWPSSTYAAPEGLVDIILHSQESTGGHRSRAPHRSRFDDLYPSVRTIPGIPHRNGGVQSRTAATNFDVLPIKNAAYEKFQQGQPADSSFQLSDTWNSLVNQIPSINGPPTKIARLRLDEICRNTDTYILAPELDSTSIQIWGEEARIAQAMGLLTKLELHTRSHGVKPFGKSWAKISAHDGRSQARLENTAKLKDLDKLSKFVGQDVVSSFELYLLWPKELDMEKFRVKYDDSILNDLRRRYPCYIDFVNEDPFYIKFGSEDETILMSVHLRVQNLVAENMRANQQTITINLLHLPMTPAYQHRVRMNHDRNVQTYFPILHKIEPVIKQAEDWSVVRKDIHRWNRKQIRKSINVCLASLQAAQMLISMRFSFGRLGFTRCKLPSNEDDGHTFEEFFDTVSNHMTRIKADGLHTMRGNLGDLQDKLIESDAFHSLATFYTVQLDIKGPNHTVRRLETVFRQGFDDDDLDTVESRWLQLKDEEEANILEINMLDLERQSFQFRVEAAEIFKPKSSDPATAFNQSNVGFTSTQGGLKSPVRRRATFPPGNPNLLRLTEIISKQFRFRDTEGIFELRREDIYDETAKPASAQPKQSIWTASYFYPDWDNLLREFGSLQPGQDVTWPRTLNTFFPSNKRPEERGALPDGFKKFMTEVDEIQELLTQAIDDL